MRSMIKGGVWKDGEDAILKAAVMKYGKNQWARVSSLLVPKSAKQCRSRWYECLDPSIKKTKWTREDDEKLLHFAKLKPTQWRRIASILRRTSSQCLERYEKLPNPEPNPACRDPVGMGEDEKEMLPEARARLANTKGKKAKRKAREKQLDEARRLASLLRKRKPNGIDSTAEIPSERSAPVRFYDTADEGGVNFPTTTERLEGKGRADIEAKLRKQDVARNRVAQRQDAPAAILQANMPNDLEATRKRRKLMLRPQRISDSELEGVAKMGYASDLLAENEELTEGSAATRALLADNSQTPTQGTFGGEDDNIAMEAENLPAPLLGGDDPELHSVDFSTVTPRNKEIPTVDPMLSSSITPAGAAHINEDMDMHEREKLERHAQPPPEESEEPGEELEQDMSEEETVENISGMLMLILLRRLVKIKLLCHEGSLDEQCHQTMHEVRRKCGVNIEIERSYRTYKSISISAVEAFGDTSGTHSAAISLFRHCWQSKGKPHLKRLAIGKSQIRLVADVLPAFDTTYGLFVNNGPTPQGLYPIIHYKAESKYERFLIQLEGPLGVVKGAFEEAVVQLRRNCFL